MQQVKFKKGDCSAIIGVQQEGKKSEWHIRMLFVHYQSSRYQHEGHVSQR